MISGLIKANLPGRIPFRNLALELAHHPGFTPGAEKLLGQGDMLYKNAGMSRPVRIQGAYVTKAETKRVVELRRKPGR